MCGYLFKNTFFFFKCDFGCTSLTSFDVFVDHAPYESWWILWTAVSRFGLLGVSWIRSVQVPSLHGWESRWCGRARYLSRIWWFDLFLKWGFFQSFFLNSFQLMVNCWFGLVVWDSAGALSVSLSNNLSFTGWSHKSKPPSQTNNWPLVSWSFVTALICHDNLQMKMFGYHIWLPPLKELELKRIPWTAARNRVVFHLSWLKQAAFFGLWFRYQVWWPMFWSSKGLAGNPNIKRVKSQRI